MKVKKSQHKKIGSLGSQEEAKQAKQAEVRTEDENAASKGLPSGNAMPVIVIDAPAKVGNYKGSGALVDMVLKYNPEGYQTDLFENLSPVIKEKIIADNIQRSELVEGIALTSSQMKIVNCLSKFLHIKSQTIDSTKADYYAGNGAAAETEYGDDKNAIMPRLGFTYFEITKEYTGKPNPSGRDIETVEKIIEGLTNVKFLIRYTETTTTKSGKTVNKIELFLPLLTKLNASSINYDLKNIELSRSGNVLYSLHPIFMRHIKNKFILYPFDIHKRTMEAYGSSNVSNETLLLREYLLKQIAYSAFTPEIGLSKLYLMLNGEFVRRSRVSRLQERLGKAIETMKALKLLLGVEIKPSASSGATMVYFKINPTFLK